MRRVIAPFVLTVLTVFLYSALPPVPAFAQDSDPELAGSAQDKKLRFFGYFSQAYGSTDGHQILGIPDDGTSAYYNVAFQLRYQPTATDHFVVQLSRERQGRSPIQPHRDDIELDWAFYQHLFPTGTYVKVGRVPIPIGIYNELRDVGTVLPFYYPPFSLYTEGEFANETLDGLVVGHTFFARSSWALDVDVYGGEWESYEISSSTGVVETHVEDALGAQLWLNTPVQGLRIGAAANRFDVSDGAFRVAESDRWKAAMLSLDGDFERFLVRSELYHREIPLGLPNPPIAIPDVESDSFYVQVGYRFDSGWSIYGQVEEGDIAFDVGFLPPIETHFWRDQALSLGYSFSPRLLSAMSLGAVVKLELHRNEGYFVENDSGHSILTSDPAETDYALLSVSLAIF